MAQHTCRVVFWMALIDFLQPLYLREVSSPACALATSCHLAKLSLSSSDCAAGGPACHTSIELTWKSQWAQRDSGSLSLCGNISEISMASTSCVPGRRGTLPQRRQPYNTGRQFLSLHPYLTGGWGGKSHASSQPERRMRNCLVVAILPHPWDDTDWDGTLPSWPVWRLQGHQGVFPLRYVGRPVFLFPVWKINLPPRSLVFMVASFPSSFL